MPSKCPTNPSAHFCRKYANTDRNQQIPSGSAAHGRITYTGAHQAESARAAIIAEIALANPVCVKPVVGEGDGGQHQDKEDYLFCHLLEFRGFGG